MAGHGAPPAAMASGLNSSGLAPQAASTAWEDHEVHGGVPLELQEALFHCGHLPSHIAAQRGTSRDPRVRTSERDGPAPKDDSLGSYITWLAANHTSSDHDLDHSWLFGLMPQEDMARAPGVPADYLPSSPMGRPYGWEAGSTSRCSTSSGEDLSGSQGNAWEQGPRPAAELLPSRLKQLEARIAESQALLHHETMLNDLSAISCQDLHSQLVASLRESLDTFKALVGIQKARHLASDTLEEQLSTYTPAGERALQDARLLQLDAHEANLVAIEIRLQTLGGVRSSRALRQNRTRALIPLDQAEDTTEDIAGLEALAGQAGSPSAGSSASSNVESLYDGQAMVQAERRALEEMSTGELGLTPVEVLEQAAIVAEVVAQQADESGSDYSHEDSYSDYSDSWWDDNGSQSQSGDMGCASEILEQLERRLATEADLDKACPICLSDVQEGQILLQLPCSHVYHPDCVLPWFETSTSCPVCKRDVEQQLFAREHERIQHQSRLLEEATDRLSARMDADLESLRSGIARVMRMLEADRIAHGRSGHILADLSSSLERLMDHGGEQSLALTQQTVADCSTSRGGPEDTSDNAASDLESDVDQTTSGHCCMPSPIARAEPPVEMTEEKASPAEVVRDREHSQGRPPAREADVSLEAASQHLDSADETFDALQHLLKGCEARPAADSNLVMPCPLLGVGSYPSENRQDLRPDNDDGSFLQSRLDALRGYSATAASCAGRSAAVEGQSSGLRGSQALDSEGLESGTAARLCEERLLTGAERTLLHDLCTPSLSRLNTWTQQHSTARPSWPPLDLHGPRCPPVVRISTDTIRGLGPGHSSHTWQHQQPPRVSLGVDPRAGLVSDHLPGESRIMLDRQPTRDPSASSRPVRSLYEQTERKMSWERIGRFQASFARRRPQRPL